MYVWGGCAGVWVRMCLRTCQLLTLRMHLTAFFHFGHDSPFSQPPFQLFKGVENGGLGQPSKTHTAVPSPADKTGWFRRPNNKEAAKSDDDVPTLAGVCVCVCAFECVCVCV